MSATETLREGPKVRAILDAARRCFAQAGFEGTSIKAIAAEAGIKSPSLLHYHFKGKDEIFLAVLTDAIQTVTQRATETGLTAEGKRGLFAVDAFFHLLDEERDLAPLLAACLAKAVKDGDTQARLAMLHETLVGSVEQALSRLLGQHLPRFPLDARTMALTITDLLLGHALISALGLPEEVTRARRQGIRTLLGSLRPDPKPETTL